MENTNTNKKELFPAQERELKEFLNSIAESAGYFPGLCEIKTEEWFGEIIKILSR